MYTKGSPRVVYYVRLVMRTVDSFKDLRRVGLSAIALFCTAASAFAQRQPSPPGTSRSSESCGRADPSYLRVANETGGQPLFFKPSEVGRSSQFMRDLSGSNHELLLWATETLDRSPRAFTVPVDSTIQKLTLTLSVNREGSALTIVRPSGAAVHAGDRDVEITELACAQVVTVTAPQPGDWRADLRGPGTFWFQAGAKTALFLTGVEFVKAGGRPGHEGLFRINGQPLLGSPATIEATLTGPIRTAEFRLVTLSGETIAPIAMTAAASSADEHGYVGSFNLPPGPFRLAVTGADSTGRLYQRVFHTLFHGETVGISPADGTPDSLPAGATTAVTFEVRNEGQSATFQIVVVDSRQFVRNVNPREFTLQAGSSGLVTVELAVPPDAPAATGSTVTITASSISGPPTTNGVVRHFDVVSTRPR
jgi:hypothetical protein